MKKMILFLLLSYSCLSQPGEVKLLSSIYNDSSSIRVHSAKLASASVPVITAATPATLLITGLIKKDSALIDKGIQCSVALAFTAVVSTGMKYGVDRQRPYAIYPALFHARAKTGPYSFPSAHTSMAFATATSLTLSFPKWYVAIPAYVWACSAGWSRMQLGVHYPTDVLMGALIGTASSFLSFKLDKWVNRRSSPTTNLPR